MIHYIFYPALFSISLLVTACNKSGYPGNYKGKPYSDAKYSVGAQAIPGKMQCEYYDTGGEGMAYHDSDSINSGSGKLNPADGSYLHEFRIKEPVDISFTKPKGVDENDYNFVKPAMDQLYVGWTNPGEWTKYTVDVKKTGLYRVGIMYTAHADGQVSLAVNNKDITGPLDISSTYVEQDTVAWRQWHHWNYRENLAEIKLRKGIQVLTLRTVANGQMNYDYLNFVYLGGS